LIAILYKIDFTKGFLEPERVTLHGCFVLKWRGGNLCSLKMGKNFQLRLLPLLVAHPLLSFPHFFDPSFSIAKKNETLYFLI
jgi:hypothetical protein